MGVPVPKIEAVDNSTAEALLSSLETVAPAERRKHASVFNYWLSIKGDRQFPPIRDLDPLEISDAGPWSVLLEMIGAGENAVIRHFGQAIKLGVEAETIARAPDPSLLACIHAKLPHVCSSMQALAFEDSFEANGGTTRCWVTLLPFSASGTWIDYVYGFVSLDSGEPRAIDAGQPDVDEELEAFQVPLGSLDEEDKAAEADLTPTDPDAEGPVLEADEAQVAEVHTEVELEGEIEDEVEPLPENDPAIDAEAWEAEQDQLAAFEPQSTEELQAETGEAAPVPVADVENEPEPETFVALEPEPEPAALELQQQVEPEPEALILEDDAPPAKAGFSSKFLESLAHVGGFYGKVVQTPNPTVGEEDAQEVVEPAYTVEGSLQNKLTDVRAMAEEARQAQIRSNQALYAGLSAAYDFALDAEDQPEEYLRLVEGEGLKIQLRSPMKPVVKLAFAETCDDLTISQLEAVLAWALKSDLPRGTLAERIEAEGGIGSILEGLGQAA